MPEPTATAIITIGGAAVASTALSVLGVPLGLRADVLVAGFLGSLVAIILLNTVPQVVDTWRGLVRTSFRRMAVAFASSITAGYLTPLSLLVANMPEPALLGMALLIGAFAQQVLGSYARKYWPKADEPGGVP